MSVPASLKARVSRHVPGLELDQLPRSSKFIHEDDAALLRKAGHMALSHRADPGDPGNPQRAYRKSLFGNSFKRLTLQELRNNSTTIPAWRNYRIKPDTGEQRDAARCRRPVRLTAPPKLPVTVHRTAQTGICLQEYARDIRDWRKLSPDDVKLYLNAAVGKGGGVAGGNRNELEGLMTAVAVGTLQAVSEGFYWAPSFNHPKAQEVSCDFGAPMSRLYAADYKFAVARNPKSRGAAAGEGTGSGGHQVEFLCYDNVAPLDVCRLAVAGAAGGGDGVHVAMVHFTAQGWDPTGPYDKPDLAWCREQQLALRTNYHVGCVEMRRQLHADPQGCVDAKGLVCTSDVAILRSPVEQDGAGWLPGPAARCDVFWVALQRHPRLGAESTYAKNQEKAEAVHTLDMIFGAAIERGVEVLVLPPFGLCRSCNHPSLDMGDLLHKALVEHNGQGRLRQVCICQEYEGQLRPTEWANLCDAALQGRPPLEWKQPITEDQKLYAAELYPRKPGPKPKKVAATPRLLKESFL